MAATIRYGVNSVTHERFSGMTVAELREEVSEDLNIPAGAEARLNGNRTDNDAQVSDGDTLEFVKVAGEKG
jgi:hypothetical protein